MNDVEAMAHARRRRRSRRARGDMLSSSTASAPASSGLVDLARRVALHLDPRAGPRSPRAGHGLGDRRGRRRGCPSRARTPRATSGGSSRRPRGRPPSRALAAPAWSCACRGPHTSGLDRRGPRRRARGSPSRCPLRWPRKLSAVRSAATIERIGPRTVATTSPGESRSPSWRSKDDVEPGVHGVERLERRRPRRRARRARARRSPRVASVGLVEERAGEVARSAQGPRPSARRRPPRPRRRAEGRAAIAPAPRPAAGATTASTSGYSSRDVAAPRLGAGEGGGEQGLGARDEVRELGALGVLAPARRGIARRRGRRRDAVAASRRADDAGTPRSSRAGAPGAPRRRRRRGADGAATSGSIDDPVDRDPARRARGPRASPRSARDRGALPRAPRRASRREHHALEQRVGGEAVRAVDAGAGDLADGEEAREGRRAVEVRHDPARRGGARPVRSAASRPRGRGPPRRGWPTAWGTVAANSSSPVASSQRCADLVARHLRRHRPAHDVARRELVDEPLAGRVAQERAMAAERLGEERSRHRGMVQRRRVELHELDVADRHAGTQRDREPVAGRGRRVRRHLEELARAAGREDHARRLELVAAACVADREAVARAVLDEQPTATACSRISATVPCVAATRARSTSAPVAAPPACRIRAWEWPPSRARCRTPVASRSKTAPSAISSSTRGGPSLDEDAHRVDVAQPRAGSERVGEVQVRRVLVVVEDRRDAALRPSRRRLRERRLGDDAHLARRRRRAGPRRRGRPRRCRRRACRGSPSGPTTAATLSMQPDAVDDAGDEQPRRSRPTAARPLRAASRAPRPQRRRA